MRLLTNSVHDDDDDVGDDDDDDDDDDDCDDDINICFRNTNELKVD